MRIKMSSIIEHKSRFRPQGGPPSAWSDEKLLLEYRDHGDRAAFEELVHRYEKELYGYLRHYLGDVEMAEDVFQQTFLQVHLKCEQFESERKLRPWLYAVATNQAIDCQRAERPPSHVSLDRRIGGSDEEESGLLVDLFDSPGRGPAEESQSSEQQEAVRRRGGVAGTDETSGDAGLFSRNEVPRGGRRVVDSRGHGEEPHPCGDREIDGNAGIGQ